MDSKTYFLIAGIYLFRKKMVSQDTKWKTNPTIIAKKPHENSKNKSYENCKKPHHNCKKNLTIIAKTNLMILLKSNPTIIPKNLTTVAK